MDKIVFFFHNTSMQETNQNSNQNSNQTSPSNNLQTIGFGAGCFWGVQSTFDQLDGVVSSSVGYQGGTTLNPTYQTVCSGMTGHAETLQVQFDPAKISIEKLLDVFFKNHNPTTKDQQGPDVGTQYRSAIFYYNQEQMVAAQEAIEELQQGMDNIQRANHSPFYATGLTFRGKTVKTQLINGNTHPYYIAEEYHQKYFAKKGVVHSCYI